MKEDESQFEVVPPHPRREQSKRCTIKGERALTFERAGGCGATLRQKEELALLLAGSCPAGSLWWDGASGIFSRSLLSSAACSHQQPSIVCHPQMASLYLQENALDIGHFHSFCVI